eukprot:gene3913-7805_t
MSQPQQSAKFNVNSSRQENLVASISVQMTDILFKLTFLIAALGVVLCFLPLFLNYHIDTTKYSDANSLPLKAALSSPSFQFSQALSISAAFPIVFDLLMDILVFAAKDFNPAKMAIWMLLLSSIVPNVVIFFYVIPSFNIEMLLVLPACRIILVVFSAFWLLNTYGPLIWRWKIICPIIAMHAVSTISEVFLPFVGDKSRSDLHTLQMFFQITPGIIILYLGFLWLKHLQNISKNSKNISPDDICCTLNLIAFFALMLATLIIQFCLQEYSNVNSGPEVFTWKINFITGYVLIVSVLNGRYQRANVILRNVMTQAEIKHDLTEFLENLLGSGDTAVDILNSLLTFERLDQEEMVACIQADEQQISQVLQNLISNALECTPIHSCITVNVTVIPKNSIRINPCCDSIKRRTIVKPTSTPLKNFILRIDVKDGGPGMTQEQQEILLTNPFSFTAGVLQTHQGQGLGLWISRKIIELHRGTLSVHSDGPGHGTTFTIHMPMYFQYNADRIRNSSKSQSHSYSSKNSSSQSHSHSHAQLPSQLSSQSHYENNNGDGNGDEVEVGDEDRTRRTMIVSLSHSIAQLNRISSGIIMSSLPLSVLKPINEEDQEHEQEEQQNNNNNNNNNNNMLSNDVTEMTIESGRIDKIQNIHQHMDCQLQDQLQDINNNGDDNLFTLEVQGIVMLERNRISCNEGDLYAGSERPIGNLWYLSFSFDYKLKALEVNTDLKLRALTVNHRGFAFVLVWAYDRRVL